MSSLPRSSLFLFLIIFSNPVNSQEEPVSANYREIFGGDYRDALNIIGQNEWWADTLQSHHIDPDFSLSIIFPELIRYSSILDYIETRGLEVLYVQYGRDYADFSVGFFQMKPSFAERIEADILKLQLAKQYPELSLINPSVSDDPENRRERIIRLKDEYYQLLYLVAFIRILDYQYAGWVEHMPSPMKLQFYSTAYNTGYFKDINVIREEMKKKRFYCGMSNNTEKYSYSGIAVEFYQERSGE